MQTSTQFHVIDLIRKKRDGGELSAPEIDYLIHGAAAGTIPEEQLAAWLMASWIRGLSVAEIRALTLAMRDSGETFSPASLGKVAVDKHSTGGVGDKTSFLVAPIAAACGLAVPMISGRALGHTGGTLDKLESIPGFRTALTLAEFEAVLQKCGACIVSQTPTLVPADRVLYSLRDRTGSVEHAGLICSSILSKKLAAGLDALVLDVKTGSGSFLRDQKACEFLGAMLVATAESAGTRTVALLTDMDQPLGSTAGNWIELMECHALLNGDRPAESEDLRELSLTLAGWMIYLGEKADTPEGGKSLAQEALARGAALSSFVQMIEAQGGDSSVFKDPQGYHRPGATQILRAWRTGYIEAMDTMEIGWAVQRTGAGRETAGEAVDAHAGIRFHARRGAFLREGDSIATIYGSSEAHLAEPAARLTSAIQIGDLAPAPVPRVNRIFNRESAEAYLAETANVGKTGDR